MSIVGPSLLFGLVGGALAAGLLTPIVFAVWVYRRPQTRCPRCGAVAPRFSRPANFQQTLWGGRTCAQCGQALPGRVAKRR